MLGINVDGMREQWRHGDEPSLRRRRRISALCAVGLADFAVITLYQLGVIRHLPDPPGRIFDSDKVNASRKAYATGVPDGSLGALLYAATLVLAAAGGTRRTGRPAVLGVALGGAAAAGAVGALDYLGDMIFKERRACPYCLVGAAINLALVPLAAREALESIRTIRKR
jgi:uncharacterized membrane protein